MQLRQKVQEKSRIPIICTTDLKLRRSQFASKHAASNALPACLWPMALTAGHPGVYPAVAAVIYSSASPGCPTPFQTEQCKPADRMVFAVDVQGDR